MANNYVSTDKIQLYYETDKKRWTNTKKMKQKKGEADKKRVTDKKVKHIKKAKQKNEG